MKQVIIVFACCTLLAGLLLAINSKPAFSENGPRQSIDEPAPTTSVSNTAAAANNGNLILDIGLSVSDPDPLTGVNYTYTISYATQSLTEEANGALIELPLPAGITALSFMGTTDVDSTRIVTVGGVPTLQVFMVDPLDAGSAGILSLEVAIPPGSQCDGTVISNTVTFSADNADNSPVASSADVTASAPNTEWQVGVNDVAVGVPGASSLFEIQVAPAASTGYVGISSGTVTADIPSNANIINCSGCSQSGNILTWNLSNVTGATTFPLVLEFPSPPFEFGDGFSIDAQLNGTLLMDCPDPVSDVDEFNGMLPSPNPLIDCGIGLSEYEIGSEGTYRANADVTGNVAIDSFKAVVSIPPQIEVTGILPSTYLYPGLPVEVSYETNLNGLTVLDTFITTTDGTSGGFAPPSLSNGEYLTSLVFDFGTVPPGFGPQDGIEIEYEVLSTDQEGNPVAGANPRITNPTYVSCPNSTYTCIAPEVEVSGYYDGNALAPEVCDDATAVARIPPVGPGSPNKQNTGGNVYFVGQEVTYTLSFNVCGPDPLVNGLVTDELPAGVTYQSGSNSYSSNITDVGTPSFNQSGQTLTWDFAGIDLPGADTLIGEECGETYTIQYKVVVDEVAQGPGNNILNNTFTIDGDGVDISPEAPLPSDGTSITIPPIGPTGLVKSSLNGNDGDPRDTITFRLRFRNQGPFGVNNVFLVDQLANGFEFVPGSINYSSGLPPSDNDGMNYDAGTRTLTFEWATLEGADEGDRYSEFYDITYDVAIPQGFPPGQLENCFSVEAEAPNIRSDLPLEDCTNFQVNAVVQTASRKGVKGACDDDFVFFNPNGPEPDLNNLNGIGRTFQGGDIDWKVIIRNVGNVEVDSITVIDILPFIGDQAVSFSSDRLSEWRPNFIEVTSIPTNATVEYTIEPNPCRQDFNPPYEPSGCTGPFWSSSAPVDITETQALKFFLPDPLGPGEDAEISFSMQAPVEAPVNTIAWNSLAYQGRRTDTPSQEYFFVAEPNKVGITIKSDTVSVGNYVWSDDNGDGVQNEPPELGINGVEVSLYRVVNGKDASPGSGDDVFVGTKLTADDHFGNPGYYYFPNLQAGQYYAVFDESTFPPGQVPPENMPTVRNAGSDDALDSDADQSTMFMTDTTSLLTQAGQDIDTTLDLGLMATECILYPTVEVECDNRGTANVNDDRYTWTISVDREFDGAVDNNGTYTMRVRNEDGTEIDIRVDLDYGVEYPINGSGFGPFDIDEGDLSFVVKDDVDLSCEAFGDVEAPATLNVTNLSSTDCMDDGGQLVYDLSGTVEVGGAPPMGSFLQVEFTESGTTYTETYDLSVETAPFNFNFADLNCNGDSYDIQASFIDGAGNPIAGTCTGKRRFHEPCYLDIMDVQLTDNCRDNGTYTVEVIGTYYNGTAATAATAAAASTAAAGEEEE